MKKFLCFLLISAACSPVLAQKVLPQIKKGTVLECTATLGGREFPLQLTVNSLSAPVSIGWSVEGYGEGSFEMSDKALQSASKRTGVTQPSPGATKLGDDETFGLISKAAYQSLSSTKSFVYDGMKFSLKTDDGYPMKIGGKEADVSHVISEDGKLEFWILNNPAFPLIVQSAGAPIDIVVNAVK